MNAKPNQDRLQHDYIVRELYKGIEGLNLKKPQNITVKILVQEPEDLNEFLAASTLLNKEGVIEKYSKKYIGQEEIEIHAANYEGRQPVYSYKLEYLLKPETLIRYMEEISLIPKYTLDMDKKRRLIVNKKYKLHTVQFDSLNYYFIDHCIQNKKGLITLDDIMKKSGGKSQRFHVILDNLDIAPRLVGIFFPSVNQGLAEFRTEVTVKDLIGSGVNEEKVGKFIKSLPKLQS